MGLKAKSIFMIFVMVLVFSAFYKELQLHEDIHGQICEDIVNGNATYEYGLAKATTACDYDNATKRERLVFRQLNIQNEIEAYNWQGAKFLFIVMLIFMIFIFFQTDDIFGMMEYRIQKEEAREAKNERNS